MKELRLDCDNDVVLLKVEQTGHDAGEPSIACHTGRHSCFFQLYRDGAWQTVDPVLKDPNASTDRAAMNDRRSHPHPTTR